MDLVKKYRPQTFDEVFGLNEVKKYFSQDYSSHKFVFHGDYGVGKTTVARIIGRQINAEVTEMNAGSETGIDNARELISVLDRPTLSGKPKLIIIDEAHALSNQAQNALLKPLEDGLNRDYVILCTTNPKKLIKGIRDRCTIFELPRLTSKEVEALIDYIAVKEGAMEEEEVLDLIIENSDGSARVAVQMYDKYLRTGDLDSIANYREQDDIQLFNLYKDLWSREAKISGVLSAAKELKQEPESLRIALINMFNSTLLKNSPGSKKCIDPLRILIKTGSLIGPDKYASINIALYDIKKSLQ